VIATSLGLAPVGAAGETDRLDPTWPPVLIAFVLAAVSAAVLLIVVVFRRLRTDARRQGGSR
jgi:hypothetical protein